MKTKISPASIRVRSLHEGQNPISLEFDASLLEYPDFSGTAKLEGIIDRMGDRLDLRAEVSDEGNFECTRCADPFSEIIHAPIWLEYVPERMAPSGEDPNIHTYDPHSESELDILPDLRDALILAIPMRHLCKPDCKGLCPTCGKNWNQGMCDCSKESENAEGWTALKTLRERLRAEENFNTN